MCYFTLIFLSTVILAYDIRGKTDNTTADEHLRHVIWAVIDYGTVVGESYEGTEYIYDEDGF